MSPARVPLRQAASGMHCLLKTESLGVVYEGKERQSVVWVTRGRRRKVLAGGRCGRVKVWADRRTGGSAVPMLRRGRMTPA